MSITIDDASFLLHLPIRGKLLNNSRISRVYALDVMVTCLGDDFGEAQIEIKYHLDATMDKSATYVHVMYLTYFVDIDRIHEWKSGEGRVWFICTGKAYF